MDEDYFDVFVVLSSLYQTAHKSLTFTIHGITHLQVVIGDFKAAFSS